MMENKIVFVSGSSGFIGGHLVKRLKKYGHYVIGADIVPPIYEQPDKFYICDLRNEDAVNNVFKGNNIQIVFNLSCLMGGMGYIGNSKHSYDIMVGSTQIISNILDECVNRGVEKYFYSSSACVYNMQKQKESNVTALKENDDFLPAWPDLMYGWQKISGELMAKSANEQYGLDIRIARFHNIFGIEGIYDGGKEKAPSALCRKVAMAKNGDEIEVWGDGSQTRSFLYIDECLEGVDRLMNSNYIEPLNIGSDELISINDLANMIIDISGKDLKIKNVTGNVGVQGRNSDNTLIKEVLGWSPSQPLRVGMEKLYSWISQQVS